jgi:hypothetical protein
MSVRKRYSFWRVLGGGATIILGWQIATKKPSSNAERLFSDLGEARTLDPLIKSQLLYQLSYQVIILLGWQIYNL